MMSEFSVAWQGSPIDARTQSLVHRAGDREATAAWRQW